MTSEEGRKRESVESVLSEHDEALALYYRLRSCPDEGLRATVASALDTLHETLRLFGPENVFTSFNGGILQCYISFKYLD